MCDTTKLLLKKRKKELKSRHHNPEYRIIVLKIHGIYRKQKLSLWQKIMKRLSLKR